MLLALIKSLTSRTAENAAPDEAPPLEEQTDEELMFAYQAGDVKAFEVLLRRHERPLFNFILRSVGRRDVAEELLQEVFLRVIKSAPKYQKTAKFTTWAYTIARNLCIDRARKWSKRHEASLDQKVGGSDGDEGRSYMDTMSDESAAAASMEHERAVFRDKLKQALAELPDEQREVFVMREFSGLKFREIAEILDIPVPTVKSRMRYALEGLRGHLAAYREHSFDEEEDRELKRG